MLIRGSYHNGFAPRDFEPAYPELWRGCVGAWCPSLGPTGGVLRDWSGRQNHGTLTNITLDGGWAVSSGAYSLALVGASSSYVPFGIDFPTATGGKYSVSLWLNSSDDSADIIGDFEGTFYPFVLRQDSATPSLQVFHDLGIVLEVASTPAAVWNHLCVTFDGSRVELWKNAVSLGSATGVAAPTAGAEKGFRFGLTTGSGRAMDGQYDDARLYNRPINPSEVALLYSGGRGRGIAYSFNQPRGSLTPGDSGSSGGTFPGLAWRALRRWRFVVRAGVDGNWPRVT